MTCSPSFILLYSLTLHLHPSCSSSSSSSFSCSLHLHLSHVFFIFHFVFFISFINIDVCVYEYITFQYRCSIWSCQVRWRIRKLSSRFRKRENTYCLILVRTRTPPIIDISCWQQFSFGNVFIGIVNVRRKNGIKIPK